LSCSFGRPSPHLMALCETCKLRLITRHGEHKPQQSIIQTARVTLRSVPPHTRGRRRPGLGGGLGGVDQALNRVREGKGPAVGILELRVLGCGALRVGVVQLRRAARRARLRLGPFPAPRPRIRRGLRLGCDARNQDLVPRSCGDTVARFGLQVTVALLPEMQRVQRLVWRVVMRPGRHSRAWPACS
jgi:hypothetical protein